MTNIAHEVILKRGQQLPLLSTHAGYTLATHDFKRQLSQLARAHAQRACLAPQPVYGCPLRCCYTACGFACRSLPRSALQPECTLAAWALAVLRLEIAVHSVGTCDVTVKRNLRVRVSARVCRGLQGC